MSIMMRSIPEEHESNSRIFPTCYVCGTPGCANSFLSVRRPASGKPFFPFLENHEPPENSQPILNDEVLSCALCAHSLQYQWQNYEDRRVPLIKRIYWLKREDGMSYSGVEMGMQTEYASQFLGLAPDPISVDERVTVTNGRSPRTAISNQSESSRHITSINISNKSSPLPKSLAVQTQPQPPIMIHVPKKCPSHNPPSVLTSTSQTPLLVAPSSKLLSQSSNTHKIEINNKQENKFAPEPQVEALDLTIDRSQIGAKSVSSNLCSPPEVLDLSMPDKNASTEVCYVCGDHYTRGSLVEMFAKEQSPNHPFFPSLMYHARPSKSHPMEASGSVQGCKSCLDNLYSQFVFFNSKEIDHKDREYLLGKQSIQINNASKVICFECHDIVEVKLAQVMFTSNSESKSYILDVEKRQSFSEGQPPTLTAKIICSACFIKKHVDASSDGSNETIDICETSSPEPKCKRILFSTVVGVDDSPQVTSVTIRPDMVEDCSVSCYMCHQVHAKNCMYWVAMLPESASSDGLYFPFMKNIHRMSTGVVSDDGRVLICSPCYHHLKRQWEAYELKSVSVERRIFSCRVPSVGSASPRRTPNMSPPSGEPQTGSDTLFQNKNEVENKSDHRCIHVDSLLELEVDLTKLPHSNYVVQPIVSQNPLKIQSKCFLCAFESKAGETYLVSSKKQNFSPMSFAFLDTHATPSPEGSIGNNNFLACTFCFHTMALQWEQFEKNNVDQYGRFYDTYNFTCYVCSFKTYRKRLQKLHVEKFPFLRCHPRASGALPLDRGHAVAVCTDCHDRLQGQYVDMERCGVPVDRRQYNWVKRPAPPQYIMQEQQGAAADGAADAAAGAARYSMSGSGGDKPTIIGSAPAAVGNTGDALLGGVTSPGVAVQGSPGKRSHPPSSINPVPAGDVTAGGGRRGAVGGSEAGAPVKRSRAGGDAIPRDGTTPVTDDARRMFVVTSSAQSFSDFGSH